MNERQFWKGRKGSSAHVSGYSDHDSIEDVESQVERAVPFHLFGQLLPWHMIQGGAL